MSPTFNLPPGCSSREIGERFGDPEPVCADCGEELKDCQCDDREKEEQE